MIVPASTRDLQRVLYQTLYPCTVRSGHRLQGIDDKRVLIRAS